MSIRLLVCDLDNTLYDWVGYFVPAFYAMVDEAVRLTGCDREQLLDDLREVHRKHYDAEHPFSLLEARVIRDLFSGKSQKEIAVALDPALHAFNSGRKEHLALYPGVREGLDALSRSGVILIAHTESKLYSVVDRLTRFELTNYFRRIYCRERTATSHPDPKVAARWLSRFPMNKVVELSHHQRKPDPDVLLEICRDHGALPEEAAYVGDSVARDILMAKDAGVFAVWAKYGAANDREDYERLVRVTHWTEADVARESDLRERSRSIKPDYVLERGFAEIVDALLPERRSAVTA